MVLTITDNQSHTYAFHNRSGSGPEERGAAGIPDRSSPAEFYHIPEDTEGIPIRRGSLVRQVGNSSSLCVCHKQVYIKTLEVSIQDDLFEKNEK